MPIRYVIREVSPGTFSVEPAVELPRWEFSLPEWVSRDDGAVIAEAGLLLPPDWERGEGADLTDVPIVYNLLRGAAGGGGSDGSGSVRS